MRIFQTAHGVSLVALSAAFAAPVAARDSGVPAAPQGDLQVREIIVTANKRAQNLNDVPISITALSGEELADKGIADPADLQKVVPGFSFAESGYQTPVYTLRGIGYFESTLAADPAVSVYVDEVALPYSAMTVGAGLDLERVEVLKGPQGILFGRNSTGGAINYIAAKPRSTFEGSFRAGYKRFGELSVGGYLTGPLSDTLSVRVAARTDQGGAWQKSYTRDDKLGDRNFKIGRVLLDWTPGDNFSAELNVNGWLDRSDTQAPQLIALIPKVPANIVNVPATFNLPLSPEKARAADWNRGRDMRNDNSLWQASLRMEYDFSPAVTLTSLTSYINYSRYSPIDQDGSVLAIIDSLVEGDIDSFFQELRLSGETDRFTWVVGGNFEDNEIFERITSDLVDATGGEVLGIRYGDTSADNVQVSKTYAAFGNAEYEILDGLTLQAGARYTKADRSFSGCARDPGNGRAGQAITVLQTVLKAVTGSTRPVIVVGPGECGSLDENLDPGLYEDTLNEDNVSWKLGVNWQNDNDLLLYANVSQGYKAGGFPTTTGSTNAQFAPVTQEKVIAYEAGFKAPLWDRRIQFNGAVFRMDYTNKQVRGIIPDPVFRTLQALVNIPESRVEGAEAQLNIEPTDGLTLNFSGTYLKTKVIGQFVSLDVFGNTVDFAGSKLPYTPEWQGVADIRYSWPVSDDISMFAGGLLSYRSDTNSQLGDVAEVAIDGYALVDLSAGIEASDGRWKLMVFGENITNKYYWSSANSLSDVVVRYAGRPATYGLTLSVKY